MPRSRIITEDETMPKANYLTSRLLDMKRVTTHPGETLNEEFLKPLNMSAQALAKEIDVSPNRLTAIIAKRRGMTADTAIRLAQYFCNSPEFWMNLQAMHDLTSAVVKNQKVYAAIPARNAAV